MMQSSFHHRGTGLVPAWKWLFALLVLLTFLLSTGGASDVELPPAKFLYEGDPENTGAVKEFLGIQSTHQVFSSLKAKVVQLYNPYCTHCIHFKTKYIGIAVDIQSEHPEIEFRAISCLHHDLVCREMFDYTSYPSLFAIPVGVNGDFKDVAVPIGLGDLTWDKIVLALQEGEKRLVSRKQSLLEAGPDGEEIEAVVVGDLATEDNREENLEEPAEVDFRQGHEKLEGDEKDEDVRGTGKQDENVGSAREKDEDRNIPEEEDNVPSTRERDEDDEGQVEAGSILKLDLSHSKWTPPGAKRARAKRQEAAVYNNAYKKWFKERLERRNTRFYKNSPEHQKWEDPDAATKLMKSYQINTPEFQKKKQKYLDYLQEAAKRKKGLHYNPSGVQAGKIGKIAYQKKISHPKLAEKVPLIKRVVKMSHEEELMLDISLAFRHTFKFDVYRATNGRFGVSTERVNALMDWLDLVYVALPPEWGIQSLVSDLKENIGPITKQYQNLRSILDKHQIPRKGWSRGCWEHGGLFCGYWKLLHTMTVGLAEHRGGKNLVDAGIRPEHTRTFSPLEAADTIHDFIGSFFFCKTCSDHFVRDYEDCEKNRRCDRLAPELEGTTDGDWKELSLWLWEVHNDFSVRILNEKLDYERTSQPLFGHRGELAPLMASPDEAIIISVLWPNLDSCITCFNVSDGSWNEPMVFRHLEKTYWPGYDSEFNVANKDLVWFEGEERSAAQMLFDSFVFPSWLYSTT